MLLLNTAKSVFKFANWGVSDKIKFAQLYECIGIYLGDHVWQPRIMSQSMNWANTHLFGGTRQSDLFRVFNLDHEEFINFIDKGYHSINKNYQSGFVSTAKNGDGKSLKKLLFSLDSLLKQAGHIKIILHIKNVWGLDIANFIIWMYENMEDLKEAFLDLELEDSSMRSFQEDLSSGEFYKPEIISQLLKEQEVIAKWPVSKLTLKDLHDRYPAQHPASKQLLTKAQMLAEHRILKMY